MPFTWGVSRGWFTLRPSSNAGSGTATGHDGVLWVGPRRIDRLDVLRVRTYLGPTLSRRGVCLELIAEAPLVVAEEYDEWADRDPTYDFVNLMFDAAWAVDLGRDLAAWLGVPHTDELA